MAQVNTGKMAGIYLSLQDMIDTGAENNQRLELLSGERYQTSPNDLGSGVLLSTGNYANPIPVDVPVATETTFGGFKYTFVGGVLNLITV